MDWLTLLAVAIASTVVIASKSLYRRLSAQPAQLSPLQNALALHITDTTRSTGRSY